MPIQHLRNRMSASLLEKVAGPDGQAERHRVHGTPGPRWFAPGSPIQRVHGDSSMYLGGIRALLLQSLHPLAMAAVDDFSDYQGDVWGRLARTATYIADTTFGTIEHAQRAVDVVAAVHRHIADTAPDGRPYRADDPHLLLWVHAAEIDSFLTAHQLFGRQPLTASEADTYVEQAGTVAIRLGTDPGATPRSRAQLTRVITAFRPELEGTPAARDVARFLRHKAPLPAAVQPGYRALTRAAVATLPRWAHAPLDLPDRPRLDATLHRATGKAMTAVMRWLGDGEPMRDPARPPTDVAPTAAPTDQASASRRADP